MLTACFRGHAYPADSTRKVPGGEFGISGLPDTILVAGERSSVRDGTFKQAQGIGLLEYAGSTAGSFNADGSITPSVNTEYRLLEFSLSR